MLACYPSFEDEEIFFGTASRYDVVVRYTSSKHTVQDLFGTHRPVAISVELPGRLESFLRRLPIGHGITVEALIDGHTLLPYYAPFTEPTKVGGIRSLMAGTSAKSADFALGLHVSKVVRPSGLQFCRACVRADTKTLGFPIWRRVHQLAGVFVCPIHGDTLYRVPGTRSLRENVASFIPLSDDSVGLGKPLDLPGSNPRMFHHMAAWSDWLLKNRPPPEGIPVIRSRLLKILDACWSSATRVGTTAMVKAMDRHASDDVLRALGCAIKGSDPFSSWIGKLCSGRAPVRKFIPPLHFMLLLDLVGASIEDLFSPTTRHIPSRRDHRETPAMMPKLVAPTEAPCGNSGCSGFVTHPSLVSIAMARPYQVSCAICGFMYQVERGSPWRWRLLRTGSVWDDILIRMGGDRTVTFQQIAKRLLVDVATVQRHMHRLGVERPGWSLPIRLENRGHSQRHLAAIERHRDAWKNLLRANSSLTQRQLILLAKGTYNFLVNNDRDWLKRHSAFHCRADHLRSIWLAQKAEKARKAKEAAIRLSQETCRPTRISISRLRREVFSGADRTRGAHSDVLTRCLSRHRESLAQFAKRRLKWACADLSARDVPLVTRSKLCQLIGLRPTTTALIESDIAKVLGEPNESAR